MKKNILSIVLICIVMVSACAQQKKTTTKAETSTTTKKTNDITYIRMERTPCFGQCPFYSIELTANGTVTYTGRQFTEYSGIYQKEISADKVAALFKKFQEKNVDTCSEEYTSMIADVPGLVYEIKYAGKEQSQQILNAHFGPHYLKEFSYEIDKIGQPDDSWKKIGEIDK